MLLHEILNIKYPIIQGAMAHIATAQFAASVSNCGALGIIGTGAMTAPMAEDAIIQCKTLTNKPFGVNLMLMNPNSAEIVDVIIKHQVAVVTTGAGNPGPYIQKLKQANIKVIPIVPTVALAKRVESAGADMVIIEGTEAGGHVGELTTMTLLPQVVDAVNIPVIAAGGIGDGRGVNAVFSLGACGFQLGTILLASDECPVHENYKQAVIKAKDSDTVVTGRSVSAPVRIMKNAMSQKYIQLEKQGATRDELEHLTLGSLSKAVHAGDVYNGSMMMGQIAGLVKEIKPLQQIFDDLMNDSIQQLEGLKALHQKLHSHV